MKDYGEAYERHARAFRKSPLAVGNGDFAKVGAIELALLHRFGLYSTDAVVDFGCGTGRLAVHLIPALTGGSYHGIDIAPTMLVEAKERVAALGPQSASVRWALQKTEHFDLPDASVDLVCAFSVFTHMEHEDSYRYLVDALRIVKPGGQFVLSCLPLEDSEFAGKIFLDSARMTLEERWRNVRCVVTTRTLMTEVALMAGWTDPVWWHGAAPFAVPGYGDETLGQSALVLRKGRP